jgi:copper oxidase (laccase) domain-containing protein
VKIPGAVEIETFPALRLAGIRHGFSTRSLSPLEQLDAELKETFLGAGFPLEAAVQAEQTHGHQIQTVDRPVAGRVPVVDALATAIPRLPLIVRVADCGPVFFYDPVRRVIALTHSGRRGTEGNIVGETVAHLRLAFGTEPADLIVQLGPCIRPPHYEIDFAAEIGRQARAAGIVHYHDSKICTASRLDRYYSYRAEKGKTGRMWAVLMLE